jgi:urease accessory protein
MVANVELAEGSNLVWREEIVVGRHNEAPGELSSRLEITRAARPLLRQEIVIGASHFDSPAVLGSAGATGTVTIVNPDPVLDAFAGMPVEQQGGEAAIHQLENGGLQVAATAADSVQLRKLLDAGMLAAVAEAPLIDPAGKSEHVPLGS